jgi:hypothetical protein
MQFLLTLETAFLLKLNSISFQYSLFAINFLSETSYNAFATDYTTEGSTIWSAEQIYLIFGLGPLILSAVGFRLLFLLNKGTRAGWKTRLALTWMTFLMVNALPCGLVAGALFYDGFGMPLQWMFGDYIFRGIMALAVVLGLLIFSRSWQQLFLNASYTTGFLDNADHQRIFVKNAYIKPVMYGLIVLMFFNWPFNHLYWTMFLICVAALPVLTQPVRYHFVYLEKPEHEHFPSRRQALYLAAGLVLVWVAGLVKINF